MQEAMNALKERMEQKRPDAWEALPDISLYMDQVLTYMDRQFIQVDEDDRLTASMVNNYTKAGLVPRADGKRYNREHLAYLTAVCILKQVMPARDIDLLIREELQETHSVESGYEAFCSSLDDALKSMAAEMEQGYLAEEMLTDGAIHFALLSYAAGVVSRGYLNILRQAKGTEKDENQKKRRKSRKETAQQEGATE